MRQHNYYPHFTDHELDAQRPYSFPKKNHTVRMAELGLKIRGMPYTSVSQTFSDSWPHSEFFYFLSLPTPTHYTSIILPIGSCLVS